MVFVKIQDLGIQLALTVVVAEVKLGEVLNFVKFVQNLGNLALICYVPMVTEE